MNGDKKIEVAVAATDYDTVIWEKRLQLKDYLSQFEHAEELTCSGYSCLGFRAKSKLQEFVDSVARNEGRAFSEIYTQLKEYRFNPSVTSVLAPIYDEPFLNITNLICSLEGYEGELILLFNSGLSEGLNCKQQAVFEAVADWLNSRFPCRLNVICLNVIGMLEQPSVGTARNLLLAAEVIRAIGDSYWRGQCSSKRLFMTDADCRFDSGFMSWHDAIYANQSDIIAVTARVRFNPCNDPQVSEGVESQCHLTLLMIGELYRNIICMASGKASSREERSWIGMGLGFTLEAGIVVGGFPHGWSRKEDHHFGMMIELLEEEKLGFVYYSGENDPCVESFIRGSKRTSAGMGYEDDGGRGCGLAVLAELAESLLPEEIELHVTHLELNDMTRIAYMPTTRLLLELFAIAPLSDWDSEHLLRVLLKRSIQHLESCGAVRSRALLLEA